MNIFTRLAAFAKHVFSSRHALKNQHNASAQSLKSSLHMPYVNCTYVNCTSKNEYEKIRNFVVLGFSGFVPYAACHYNVQLDMLGQDGIKKIPYDDYEYMIQFAMNYFIRNRSRLLEWWCLRNKLNPLMLSDEFNVLYDMYGFNVAFKIYCKKQFSIDVCPDEKYNYGVPMFLPDNSVNHVIEKRILHERSFNFYAT